VNTQSTIRDPLMRHMVAAISSLVTENVDGIAAELVAAEDGNLSVSFSVKLSLSGNRVSGVSSVSYSRKFKDESEFITEDPSQIPLPMGAADGMTREEAFEAVEQVKARARKGGEE